MRDNNALADLVEMAHQEGLPGEWTDETARERCDTYARLILRYVGE